MSRTGYISFYLFLAMLVLAWTTAPSGVRLGNLVRYPLSELALGIGMTVSVPPNPLNTVNEQLDNKARVLTRQEEDFQQRVRYFSLFFGLAVTALAVSALDLAWHLKNRKLTA